MGKILVKASEPRTMVDAQGNVQFMYGNEGQKSGYGGAVLGGLGKVIGAGLGAAGPHRNLLSLLGGMQGGAATGQQAGRYLAKPFDAAERYLRRPKEKTPAELYAEAKGQERQRQKIRGEVSRELKPQTQEEMMNQLRRETGNDPARLQRLVNYFNQGTEAQHDTTKTIGAITPMPHPNKTREQPVTDTNPGLPPTAVGVTQPPPPLPTSQDPLPPRLADEETIEGYADKMERLAQQAKMNNAEPPVAVT